MNPYTSKSCDMINHRSRKTASRRRSMPVILQDEKNRVNKHLVNQKQDKSYMYNKHYCVNKKDERCSTQSQATSKSGCHPSNMQAIKIEKPSSTFSSEVDNDNQSEIEKYREKCRRESELVHSWNVPCPDAIRAKSTHHSSPSQSFDKPMEICDKKIIEETNTNTKEPNSKYMEKDKTDNFERDEYLAFKNSLANTTQNNEEGSDTKHLGIPQINSNLTPFMEINLKVPMPYNLDARRSSDSRLIENSPKLMNLDNIHTELTKSFNTICSLINTQIQVPEIIASDKNINSSKNHTKYNSLQKSASASHYSDSAFAQRHSDSNPLIRDESSHNIQNTNKQDTLNKNVSRQRSNSLMDRKSSSGFTREILKLGVSRPENTQFSFQRSSSLEEEKHPCDDLLIDRNNPQTVNLSKKQPLSNQLLIDQLDFINSNESLIEGEAHRGTIVYQNPISDEFISEDFGKNLTKSITEKISKQRNSPVRKFEDKLFKRDSKLESRDFNYTGVENPFVEGRPLQLGNRSRQGSIPRRITEGPDTDCAQRSSEDISADGGKTSDVLLSCAIEGPQNLRRPPDPVAVAPEWWKRGGSFEDGYTSDDSYSSSGSSDSSSSCSSSFTSCSDSSLNLEEIESLQITIIDGR